VDLDAADGARGAGSGPRGRKRAVYTVKYIDIST